MFYLFDLPQYFPSLVDTIIFSFSINIGQDTIISKLLYIGIIFALTKANSYMKDLFGGISTTIHANLSGFR